MVSCLGLFKNVLFCHYLVSLRDQPLPPEETNVADRKKNATTDTLTTPCTGLGPAQVPLFVLF